MGVSVRIFEAEMYSFVFIGGYLMAIVSVVGEICLLFVVIACVERVIFSCYGIRAIQQPDIDICTSC